MNRGEIRSAVQQRLAIPSSGDGLLTDSVVNGLIDQSLSVISGENQWPWLLTTATLSFAPSTAALPSDFIMSRSLVYNGYPVQWIQLEDFLDPDRFFSPFGWTIIGSTATLTPAPSSNANGTLYYYRKEPSLSADASTPLLPATHHNLIIAHTSYLACLVRQDEQRASVNFSDYRVILDNLRDDLKQNTSRRIRFDRGKQYAAWS